MNKTQHDIAWNTACVIIGCLFSGNIYFLKHSLDRLDSMESVVWGLKQEIAVLHATMSNRKSKLNTSLEISSPQSLSSLKLLP